MVDSSGVIRDDLAGKRIAVTGATGFLGTALVERLLRSAPDCELVLLIRPGRKRTVEQRAQREIFKNDCFDRLRDELGGRQAFDEMVARRVQVIAGDVGTDGLGLDDGGRAVLATCDVVIHSAATVSFDSPLDLAVEVNLLGPTRIAQTLGSLDVTPHLVAVSTCYVAGNRRGAAPEVARRREPVLERRRLAPRGRGRPAGCGPTPRRRAVRPRASPRCPPPPGTSSAPPEPRCSPPRPSSAARTGSSSSWSTPVAPEPRRWAGPTSMPSPRRSARRRWPRTAATSRCRSCGRRSSSRRGPSRCRAGSAASAWPSR